MAENMLSEKLEMGFATDHNTNVKIFVQDPLKSLDAEGVSAIMETMVGKGVLRDSKGNTVTAAMSARILRTLEQNLF